MPSGGPTALVGTAWQWQQTLMGNDDRFGPTDPGSYTLEFESGGTVAIHADCNRVAGRYAAEGAVLTIELGPSTMAACPDGSLGDRFVANLGAVSSFVFDGDDLVIALRYDSGTMRFAAASDSLPGSSWTVIGYNNGRGGVVSVLTGTEASVAFGPEGTLTGSTGCNGFSASYRTEGDGSITIGPAMATRMACDQPGGIMDQEQEFLAALGTAATFRITGARMEVRTAEGSIAATFQRHR